MSEETLHNSEEPKIIPEDALLQKRDDQKFMAEMEQVVKDGEEARVRFMTSYRNRELWAIAITVIFVFAGAAGFVWFFIMNNDMQTALSCVAAGIGVPMIFAPLKQFSVSAYRRYHKHVFLPEMAQALGGFKYFPSRGISSKVLQKSGVMFPFAAYEAEDCFMGVYKGVKVIFSEASLYADRGKRRPVFSGTLVLLELPATPFEGHTIVTSDIKLAQHFAHTRWSALQQVSPPRGDNDWSRFQIFTSAPANAANVVNEKFLKEFLEISNIFDNAPASAVMMAKKFLFIVIPHEDDMFEASDMRVPVTFKAYMDKSRREIGKILEIIDIYEMYRK